METILGKPQSVRTVALMQSLDGLDRLICNGWLQCTTARLDRGRDGP